MGSNFIENFDAGVIEWYQEQVASCKAEINKAREKISRYEKLKGDLNSNILANLKKSSSAIGGIRTTTITALTGNISNQEQRNISRCIEEISEVILDINMIILKIDKKIEKLNKKIRDLRKKIENYECEISIRQGNYPLFK